MKKAILIDFHDSFTFNIAAELESTGFFQVQVIQWQDWPASALSADLLVLGPGPGHPDEYLPKITSALNEALECPQCFVLGICLGHQLIWRNLTVPVVSSAQLMHGQSIELKLSGYWQNKLSLFQSKVRVQRYNSLVVDAQHARFYSQDKQLLFHHEELMMSCWPGVMTYQFHPESIGTTYPQKFFCFLNDCFL